jgi:simple sugar transport system permease protein
MIWGLAIAALAWLLFNRHRFGLHVCFTGDNAASAREMGVAVDTTRMLMFLLVGFASGLAAVFVCVNNLTFWPSAGDGYLLLVLAAVFLGGTPTWGGVGTIAGGVIGAFILGFMETGIIAAGFSTFSTQFFYGLILLAALVSHRMTGARRR